MYRQSHSNTSPAFSMADTWGSAQVAVDTDQRIAVDLTGRQYSVDARLMVSAALVRLSISQAHRLGEAIIAAAAAASEIDVRQPGLWSDATTFSSGRAP
jgi:hypothetical protein